MGFRPCIDLHDGCVKQIVGSSLRDHGDGPVTNFTSDHGVEHYVKMYKQDELLGGHVIKLGPNNDAAARHALSLWPNALQIGGGIDENNAKEWIEAGASAVIVTSAVFKDGKLDWARLERIVGTVGRERVVLDLSCRRKQGSEDDGQYYVVTDRWQKFTDVPVSSSLLRTLADSCTEFLVHGVDVEGMQCGVLAPLIEILAESPIPVTYAGGVASMQDLETVERIGKGRVHVTVGSALDIFGGQLPYRDVVAWSKSVTRTLC